MIQFTKNAQVSLAIVLVCAVFPAITQAEETDPNADAEGIAFFEKKIRPVLVEQCFKCHSEEGDKIKGGLLLDNRDAILRGGNSGHAVVPGNLQESLLFTAITYADEDYEMPPKRKLPEAVIADFEKWILMGAPDPRKADKVMPITSLTIDIEAGREHWAYQAPKMPDLPEVKQTEWPSSKIDRFVLAELEEKGLQPSAEADKMTLLRRVYFDLAGLPPTIEEVRGFLKDEDPKAYEKVVDRLLESEHFGERWGRHWLDVARYAESSGKEANLTYPFAWRYRDYVIDSFNADKPYDEFLTEQIAGDLLHSDSPEERAENLIATGFLAMGPKSLNEGNLRQFTMDQVDEQIDTVTQAVLATTVACARCHDHKFDPIPTKDYYSLAGIFLSTDTYYGTVNSLGVRRGSDLMVLPVKDKNPTAPSYTLGEIIDMEYQLYQQTERQKELQSQAREMQRAGDDPGNIRLQLLALNSRISDLQSKIASVDDEGQPRPFVMGVMDKLTPADANVLVRGDIDQPTDQVPRGFVQVLYTGEAPAIPDNQSGRLELAQWITDDANPLTARVMVNRVWHYLFGKGLVTSVDNFGTTGQAPSHPELLDYLALRFQKEGWSIKTLIREIVLSSTYRQSSDFDKEAFLADADNALLWRMSPRRLDAESLRDAMLAASGKLDTQPPHGSVVASAGNGLVGRTIDESIVEKEKDYRSVYLPVIRDLLPESLDVFDFADPGMVSGTREITNVPSQALYMMNNPFVISQADALAKRIVAEKEKPIDRITLAYALTMSRMPTEGEMKTTLAYFKRFIAAAEAEGKDLDAARDLAVSAFCQALYGSAEFRYLN